MSRSRIAAKVFLGICASLPAVVYFSSPAFAQKAPKETVESFTVADGFEVKLFASEPMIVNPIALDIDTKGRVWVTEGVNYRRNVNNPPDNKLKVLEDTDGDGVADKVTVFASDLNAAMGVCVAGTKIYVPESPNLYVYEDKDGDLKPDGPRTTLLTGFGGKNHDHGVHSQMFGPDHKLYMTNGDSGYDLTGPDGKKIQFRWGGMIRCEADGTQLEDFAVNFRNPVELGVDSFGHVWCSDNDNDGLKSVRICWILEGGNYGWFGGPEMIREPDGSFNPIHHWRADKPGFVPYVLITGFGSPCGMTFYEGDAFGSLYKNKILHCDAGPREIRVYSPQRLPGIGYTAKTENIVTSSDAYFRPVDPCVAPDGSIFVSDWYDGGVGGHAYNDPSRGRIYRITPKGVKPTRKEKPGPYVNDADALVALASPNLATQFLARERLLTSGEKAVPDLVAALLSVKDRPLKARILWLLDRIGGNTAGETLRALLTTDDPEFRALAVRILRRHGDKYVADILKLAENASLDGEVLTEVLLAAGKSSSPAATATVLKAYERYDGNDRYLLETLAIASRGREGEVFQNIVDRPGVPITPRVINIVRILKADDATKYFAAKLTATDLPAGSRPALIDALASVASPEAGKSIAGLLTQKVSLEDQKLAIDVLRRNLTASWSALKNDPALKAAVTQALTNEMLAADAVRLIGDASLPGFNDAVVTLIANAKAKEPVRLAAIEVSARLGLAAAGPQLASLHTAAKAPETAIADASIRALVTLRDMKTIGELLAAKQVPTPVKQLLTDQLAGTSDGAVFLLRLIDTNKLDKQLAARTIAAAVEHPDVNIRLLFQKYIPEADRPKTLGQTFKADDILALNGDTTRGEAVFLRSGAASCNKCHRVKGQGTDIGPDLSLIGRKYERKALLETIMNPSAGIAPEYVPYVVETDAGKVFAGFLHEQNNERVVLKIIDGSLINVNRSNIVELAKQSISLMPELVLKNVTAQDAADLLAYLSSLQTAIIHASNFKMLGTYPNNKPEHRGTDFGPEKATAVTELKESYPNNNGQRDMTWRAVPTYVGRSGIPQIDLTRLNIPRKENVICYFAATLDSAAEQPATLYVGSDDGVQVWVNGKKVHDAKLTRILTPASDKIAVTLKQGKNLILLKLDQGNGPAGLTLSAEARGNVTFGVP